MPQVPAENATTAAVAAAPAPSVVPGAGRHGGATAWWGKLHGLGPVIGLVLLCIAGTLLNSNFATYDNVMNVLTRTAFIGIIAVGMCFVIISGGIDLSVGSMAALIAGSVILFMNAMAPVLGSPMAAAAAGMLLAGVVGGVILNRTAYGRYVQAIGSNEQVAQYAAVDVHKIKILTYMLLGVCVGIATLLYVPRLGSASPTTGLLWELEAIAAVIVGGTVLKGGAGSITGTVVGAILLSVISNILNLTSIISVYLNAAVQGFVIIAVAFMQRGKR